LHGYLGINAPLTASPSFSQFVHALRLRVPRHPPHALIREALPCRIQGSHLLRLAFPCHSPREELCNSLGLLRLAL
jgi:hypothetical protein